MPRVQRWFLHRAHQPSKNRQCHRQLQLQSQWPSHPPAALAAAASAAAKSPPVTAPAAKKPSTKAGKGTKLTLAGAEGYNTHVSCYYYFSDTWGTSHPHSHATCVLKNNSKQRVTAGRGCSVSCRLEQKAASKPVSQTVVHWWKEHAQPAWNERHKTEELCVTTYDLCHAVINIKLFSPPCPKSTPSHPKGVNKKLLRAPFNKTITPAASPQRAKAFHGWPCKSNSGSHLPELKPQGWGRDLFFGSLLEGTSDVQQFPHSPPCQS